MVYHSILKYNIMYFNILESIIVPSGRSQPVKRMRGMQGAQHGRFGNPDLLVWRLEKKRTAPCMGARAIMF